MKLLTQMSVGFIAIMLFFTFQDKAFADDENVAVECKFSAPSGKLVTNTYEINFREKEVLEGGVMLHTVRGNNDEGVVYRITEMSDEFIELVAEAGRGGQVITRARINRKNGIYHIGVDNIKIGKCKKIEADKF